MLKYRMDTNEGRADGRKEEPTNVECRVAWLEERRSSEFSELRFCDLEEVQRYLYVVFIVDRLKWQHFFAFLEIHSPVLFEGKDDYIQYGKER